MVYMIPRSRGQCWLPHKTLCCKYGNQRLSLALQDFTAKQHTRHLGGAGWFCFRFGARRTHIDAATQPSPCDSAAQPRQPLHAIQNPRNQPNPPSAEAASPATEQGHDECNPPAVHLHHTDGACTVRTPGPPRPVLPRHPTPSHPTRPTEPFRSTHE